MTSLKSIQPSNSIRKAPKICATPGILHIGTGRFVLGHLGAYVQDILKKDTSWGIVTASIRSCSVLRQLEAHSGEYLLGEAFDGRYEMSMMDSVVDTVDAVRDPRKLVKWMADPRIRLLTLTVTSNGYHLMDKELNMEADAIKHDLEKMKSDDFGKFETIYGYLAFGLKQRQLTGIPLTVMPLDNLEKNGLHLKRALLTFLGAVHNIPCQKWIDESVQFVSTVVDRIVPSVTTAEVTCESIDTDARSCDFTIWTEPFKELVIEQTELRLPSPPWQHSGAEIVPDCTYHWKRKGLIINGGHHVLAVASQRLGIHYVHEAMRDPHVSRLLKACHRDFLRVLVNEEHPLPEISMYVKEIQDRFRNSSLPDDIYRVGRSSTRKVAQRFFEPILDHYHRNKTILRTPTFAAAIWLFNLVTPAETGVPIQQTDERVPLLCPLIGKIRKLLVKDVDSNDIKGFFVEVGSVLRDVRFSCIAEIEQFLGYFTSCIRMIASHGLRNAIDRHLKTSNPYRDAQNPVIRPSYIKECVLLDCDGTLVDSESLAFSGCCDVVNELLLRKNVAKTYEWKKLKQEFVGCSFRSIVEKLGQMYSFSLAHGELDQLAREEDERVTSVLKKKVELCDGVMDAIVNLKSNGTPIAVVSSSSLPRVRACLQKTDLDRHIPPNQVYSAVSSLPVPKSKPDPEVYLYALQDMGMRCEQCFAVEDSVNGTLAAVGAGIDVIGYVGSLEHEERATASAELMNAGAFIVITHWDDFWKIWSVGRTSHGENHGHVVPH